MARADDEDAFTTATADELGQNHAALERLTETDRVGQQNAGAQMFRVEGLLHGGVLIRQRICQGAVGDDTSICRVERNNPICSTRSNNIFKDSLQALVFELTFYYSCVMETPTLQANGKQTGRPLGLTVHPAAMACSITTAAGPSLPAGIPDPQFTVSEQARREAFASLDHAHHQVIAAETAELVGILHAAQLWAVTCDQIDASIERVARTEKLRAYGHDGTPHIGEFLALEIGPLLGISAHTAICRIADALDLAYRFPKTLSQVLMGTIRVWQALKASHRCNDLPLAAALEVDTQLADALKTLPFSMVMKRLDEWIIAAGPALAAQRAEATRKARYIRISPIEDGHVTIHGILDATDGILFDTILTKVAALLPSNPDVDSFTDHDLRRTQALGVICRHHQTPSQAGLPATSTTPTSAHTLIIHINADDLALGSTTQGDTTEEATGFNDRHLICHQPHLPPVGVARIEDWGPLLTSQLPEFLKDTKVVVRPIIDPAQIEPTDVYQIPAKMRFAIEQRNPVDVFPYGTTAAKHCDLDHAAPYIRGRNAPAGQTSPGNLGPLSRTIHRAKTFGGWQLHQPAPGHYTWTSKLGYRYKVTSAGTTRIQAPG